MLVTEALVRENATKLKALYDRIDETLPFRSSSKEGRTAWEDACEEFHAKFDDLFFPGGLEGWQDFLSKKNEGVDAAILFLEVDSVVFRSGYIKQIIWKKVKQIQLTGIQKYRLESVARAYLKKPLRREFWHMVRYARLRGSPVFWTEIEELASQNFRSEEAVRAGWLMLAYQNEPVRNMLKIEILRPSWQIGYLPQRDLWQSKNQSIIR